MPPITRTLLVTGHVMLSHSSVGVATGVGFVNFTKYDTEDNNARNVVYTAAFQSFQICHQWVHCYRFGQQQRIPKGAQLGIYTANIGLNDWCRICC